MTGYRLTDIATLQHAPLGDSVLARSPLSRARLLVLILSVAVILLISQIQHHQMEEAFDAHHHETCMLLGVHHAGGQSLSYDFPFKTPALLSIDRDSPRLTYPAQLAAVVPSARSPPVFS
jgi:hypothetical protein